MPNTHTPEMRHICASRLKAARIAAGFKKRTDVFANFPQWSRSTYESHELGRRRFDVEDAIKYADAFECNPKYLLAHDVVAGDDMAGVPIRNAAFAGNWRDGIGMFQGGKEKLFIRASPVFPAWVQYCRRVVGDGIADHARDGEYIIFAHISAAISALRPGAIVDARRTGIGPAVHSIWIYDGICLTTADPSLTEQRAEKLGYSDGVDVEIVGIAIGAYRDLSGALPSPLNKKPAF